MQHDAKRCPPAQSLRQGGFTLIELVVVLTIVAVLAAIALPRYVNLQRDARIGHLQAARGAVSSGATLVHAAMLARRGIADPWPCPAGGGVVADNQLVGAGTACTEAGIIHTMNGYPAATGLGTPGIISAAGIGTNFNPTAADLAADGYIVSIGGGSVTLQRSDAPTPATCGFTYTEPSGSWTAASYSTTATAGC